MKRPPLGIMPHKFWIEMRINDLEAAIVRYTVARMPVPKAWQRELDMLRKLKGN